ncbi:MAG: hypothetical protein DLM73_01455 [Chthoniobacterales bacterium]|nr:MAG: hypothetical protein DLM73_01455 [Chthoniobacterales bacterium]
MQNGHNDPEALLQKVRSEVRKRKLALEKAQPDQEPQPALVLASSSPEAMPPQESLPSKQFPEKPRLKRAHGALDRAASKNDDVRRWPRFLRGLRRNQGAVNESLIGAVESILETAEWLRQKFTLLETRTSDQGRRGDEQQRHLVEFRQQQEKRAEQDNQQLGDLARQITEQEERAERHRRRATEAEHLVGRQSQQLAELERKIEERRSESTRQEGRVREQNGRMEEQQRQLLDLSYKLIAFQGEISARFEEAAAQQLLDKRQLLDLQNFVREQERQRVEEHRQLTELARELAEERQEDGRRLTELQEFVNAQHRQNAEDSRLLEEQQGQLTQAREMMQASVAAQQKQTAEEQRQLSELQQFVDDQRAHRSEEQKRFEEQRRQLEEFNLKLIEYQNDVCARYHLTGEELERAKGQLAEMQGFIRAQEEQTIEEERQLREQQERLAEIRGGFEALQARALPDSALVTEVGSLRDRVNAAQASFAIIQAHLLRAESTETFRAIAPSLSEDLKKHETDAFYLAFENQFRGDRELITARLRFYMPVVEESKATTGNASAVDLGCGRGEWLELLREQSYQGVGVDLNVCMVEECRSRGLKVECADAIAYLRDLPSASLSLVTGFHIVEHLPFAQLFDLFRESFRVLCPQGTAIFETPNPECARVPAYSFYLDPTHRNPIPQELLCFAARQTGFGSTRVERLQPYFELGDFKGYLDYAGIFTK